MAARTLLESPEVRRDFYYLDTEREISINMSGKAGTTDTAGRVQHTQTRAQNLLIATPNTKSHVAHAGNYQPQILLARPEGYPEAVPTGMRTLQSPRQQKPSACARLLLCVGNSVGTCNGVRHGPDHRPATSWTSVRLCLGHH